MRTTFDDIGSCSFVDQLRYICFLLPFYHPKMSESGELEFYSCSESSTYHEKTDHDFNSSCVLYEDEPLDPSSSENEDEARSVGVLK